MVDHITLHQRFLIHKATKALLQQLFHQVNSGRENESTSLTTMLLKRLWRAALQCPGFSVAQKDDIIVLANLGPDVAMEYGLPPFAHLWVFMTIVPNPKIPMDVVEVTSVPSQAFEEFC
jgi:hypothetical protein